MGLPRESYAKISKPNDLSMYLATCCDCGKRSVKTWSIRENQSFRCQECKNLIKTNKMLRKRKIDELQFEQKLETAEEIIRKQYNNFDDYKSAFDWIKKNGNRKGWFQSVNEVLTAAELIRTKTKCQHQIKFYKWTVDFVLDNLKVVLEIDGGFHQNLAVKQKDTIKDLSLRKILEPGWKVVHIDDKIILEDLQKLLPEIKKRIF